MNRFFTTCCVLFLPLLLVAGCGSDGGGDGGEGVTATQPAATESNLTALEEKLASVLIGEGDLPRGLQGTGPDFSTNEEMAAGPEGLAAIEATGRQLGVSVQFLPTDQLDPSVPVRGGIESAASVYETAGGASETFGETVAEARANDWAANYPSLGDVSVREIEREIGEESLWLRIVGTAACEFVETPTPVEAGGPTPTCAETQRVVLDNVLFRQGRVRGYLHVSGLFAPVSGSEVYVDQVLEWVELMAGRAATEFP